MRISDWSSDVCSSDLTDLYVISAEENAALCRSTGVEPASDGTAHPIYYYIATQVAMGKTVAGVCETCEFDVEDGPMMGSSGVVFQIGRASCRESVCKYV